MAVDDHVWHWFLPMLDEAARAIDFIGRFVRGSMAQRDGRIVSSPAPRAASAPRPPPPGRRRRPPVLADVDGVGVEKLAARAGRVAVPGDVHERGATSRAWWTSPTGAGAASMCSSTRGRLRVQPLLEVTEPEWTACSASLKAVFFVLQAGGRGG